MRLVTVIGTWWMLFLGQLPSPPKVQRSVQHPVLLEHLRSCLEVSHFPYSLTLVYFYMKCVYESLVKRQRQKLQLWKGAWGEKERIDCRMYFSVVWPYALEGMAVTGFFIPVSSSSSPCFSSLRRFLGMLELCSGSDVETCCPLSTDLYTQIPLNSCVMGLKQIAC